MAFASAVGGARADGGHGVRYLSKHPLPRKIGHGFCYIDVPHVHDYPPPDARLYRVVGGQYYFVGDPAPFEYEGRQYPYYGPHPIADAGVELGGPVYCYLRGPHYHWYMPPAEAHFELRGGAYWYVGTYDPVYYDERPRFAVINDAYAPFPYARPVVDVTVVPAGFHGEIVAAGPGISAGVHVGGPPPPPAVEVGVGVGIGGPPVLGEPRREVIVHDHRDRRGGAGWRGSPRLAAPQPGAGGWRARGAEATPQRSTGGGWRESHPAAMGPHVPPSAERAPRPSGGGPSPAASHRSGGGSWRR